MMLHWNIVRRGGVPHMWSYLVVNSDLWVGVALIEWFDLTDVLLQGELHHSEHHWHLCWQLGELQLSARGGGTENKIDEQWRMRGRKRVCKKGKWSRSMDWAIEATANYSVKQQNKIVLMFSLGSEFSIIANLLCDILQELFWLLWKEHNKAL